MPLDMWFVQGVGVLGLLSTIVGFQSKKRTQLLLWQIISAACFMLHYALLMAWVAAAGSAVVFFRNIVFEEKETNAWAKSRWWLYFFLALPLFIPLFVWDGPISLLPVTGTIIATYGLWHKDPKVIRMSFLISSLFWLPYVVVVGSIPGIVRQLVIIAAVVLGMCRHDTKKNRGAR